MKRKSKAQLGRERIEREQKRAEAERRRKENERVKAAEDARKREETKRREWLRVQRSRPRTELPAMYGETIHVHQRILDAFMKQMGKKLQLLSSRVVGGTGGRLVIEYETKYGGRGMLELNDLGPMP